MIARPVVLLPQPDSPTRPSVSPRLRLKLMPSTARTSPMWRSKTIPSVIGNQTLRSSTSTRSLLAVGRREPRTGPSAVAASAGQGHRTSSSVWGQIPRRRTRAAGRPENPSRSGRPAAASSAVGRLWQATRWVASGPEVRTRSFGSRATSAGLSVQQTGSRHAQRGANGTADRRASLVGWRPLDRDELLGPHLVQARDRMQQAHGVRMRRGLEELRRWSPSRR